MESFEYQGVWWIPEHEDLKVEGRLTFSPLDGARLEIDGHAPSKLLAKSTWTPRKEPSKIEILIGTIRSGEQVTLVHCRCRSWILELAPAVFDVATVLIGCHLNRIEDVKFDSVLLRYSNLEKWLGIQAISLEYGFAQENTISFFNIQFTLPDKLSFRTEGMSLTFHHGVTTHTESLFDYGIHQTCAVEIQPDTPLHWDDYLMGPIYYLRNFLALGMGTTVLPIEVKATRSQPIGDLSEETASKRIGIYHRTQGADVSPRDKVYEHEMLFRYPDLADGFEKYLANWFAKADKLRTVFDLYFSLFYIPQMYVQQIFLTLAQALEVYHRDLYGGEYVSEKDYQAPLTKLKTQVDSLDIDDDLKKRLKDMLKYGYQFSLRKRMKEIRETVLKGYSDILYEVLPITDDFIHEFVKTRNDLTHPSESDDTSKDLNHQYELARKARLLMEFCFLNEMGVPPDLARRLFASRSSQRLRL